MADDPATPPPSPATRPDAAPSGPHVGIRQARTQLGELADHARYLDQVTYLTKHGRPVAAIVPPEAARTRAQLAALTQQTHAERDAERATYERLDRAAAQTLDPIEVLWGRAYHQVWEVLEDVADNFHWRVEEIVERELAAERSGTCNNDGQDDEDADDAGGREFDFLKNVTALRDAERQRRELAEVITAHAAELEGTDARHPDRAPALDWLGWARRIEHITGLIAAARPRATDPRTASATAFARRRLADALAEAATLLRELDTLPGHLTTPPAEDYGLERRIWDAAFHNGLPLITSLAELGGAPGRYTDAATLADYARHQLVRLHRDGKVKLYRYLGGRPHQIDPAQIIPEARFHLVPVGDRPDDWEPDRPVIVTG